VSEDEEEVSSKSLLKLHDTTDALVNLLFLSRSLLVSGHTEVETSMQIWQNYDIDTDQR
jgi:hypothetical protein